MRPRLGLDSELCLSQNGLQNLLVSFTVDCAMCIFSNMTCRFFSDLDISVSDVYNGLYLVLKFNDIIRYLGCSYGIQGLLPPDLEDITLLRLLNHFTGLLLVWKSFRRDFKDRFASLASFEE